MLNASDTLPASFQQAPPPPGALRVIPLGGVGEFGKNAMVLEYGSDMLLLDCGQQFPDTEMLGIDVVIPDFSYILENLERFRGIVLTHGHEDHIGSVPYLVRQLGQTRVPIFGSRLTLAFVREKLIENGLENRVDLTEVHEFDRLWLGGVEVEFIPVSHSCPMAMSLLIHLPEGLVLHTGDYRIDAADTSLRDALDRARQSGREVLLLMADSTNVDRRGRSANETQIRAGLGPILAAARQTVVLATFSSNLYRVQSVLDLAEELGRKVAICGYSLERNCGIALQLGILHHHGDLVRPLQDVVRLPPNQRLIITTGTQGEPSSALTRMALNSFRGWRVEPGDTIILSSRIIPGNERGIYRMINHFYRHGARVVTERDGLVHGSGHAYQDEMRELFEIVRPRHFIPVHGELRQLIHNQDFAQTCGLSDDQVTVMLNGEQVTLHDGSINLEETSWAGQVLVDGKMLDGVEEVVLRDRRHLAEDGMVTVVLAIDKDSRRIVSGPDIITRGFVHVDENEPLLQACRDLVLRTYEQCEQETQEEWEVVKVEIRKALRKFLREQTDRYPVILPVVMEL